VDWLYFAILVAIVAVVGIAVGLFFAGRLARQGERRVAEGGDEGTSIMMAAGAVHGEEASADGGSGNGGGDGGGGDGGGGD
jgi:hypothetical protein